MSRLCNNYFQNNSPTRIDNQKKLLYSKSMSAIEKQCCKTCKHSRWWLTDSGRIKKNYAGRCVVELPVLKLPSCIKEPILSRSYVWPGEQYGDDCPLYEVNNGKPFSERTA